MSATANARDFKCTRVGHVKSYSCDEWFSLSGRGQVHVNNFYIVDLENFATASRRYTGDILNSVRGRFVYDTYKTMEATRSSHGWVHCKQPFNFITSVCSGLVVQVVCALLRGNWQDLNWHDASRRPSAIVELLV